MDYSGLVESIQNGDEKETSRLCNQATPILRKYLVANTGASFADADDAIQKMFEYVIIKIKDDQIQNPKALLSYMLTASKHSYIRMKNKRERQLNPDLQDEPIYEPNQIWDLIEGEKQDILKMCFEKLSESYQKFCSYLFEYPDAEAEDAAEHFGISSSNAYTRKHRIIKKLRECIQSAY